MAREANSEECSARILSGNETVVSAQPCEILGQGECVKDRQRELNPKNVVCTVGGVCLADSLDGTKDPVTPESLLNDIQDIDPDGLMQAILLDAIQSNREDI